MLYKVCLATIGGCVFCALTIGWRTFYFEEEKTMETKTCPKCGKDLSDENAFCPNCGSPIAETQSGNTPDKKRKRIILISVVSVAALLFLVLIILLINTANERKYDQKLEEVTYKMLDGAADAEDAGNLIISVWKNTIYETSDPKTDPYTKTKNGKGVFYDDFNDALSCLFSDPDFIEQIDAIKANQDEVLSLMKSLKNPSKKYRDAYEELKIYYDNYSKMTSLVVDPKGSLKTFSETFNELDESTVNSFKKMKIYFD